MAKSFDVVIAGDVYCDLIFTGLPRIPVLGEETFSQGFHMSAGGVFNTVATLRRLGVSVGLCCHIGTDPFSRFVLEQMEEEDIDLSLVEYIDGPMRRVSVALSFTEDRGFVSYADPRPSGPSAAEVLSRYNFRHLHVHWLGQLWEEPELLELARQRGATISLDSQCCPDEMGRDDAAEQISKVDVFMPNEMEALQITKTTNPQDALKKMAAWTRTAVIKLGKDGVMAMQDSKFSSLPALPVSVVDTTGAGDAFAGGFLYAQLAGMTIEECLLAGTICGGMSASGSGGVTSVPRLAELQQLMRKAG